MTFALAPHQPGQPVLTVRPDLAVISLSGEEVRPFLNDILTAQIETLDEATARPTCLLSPQGRILSDMMVMASPDKIYLITEQDQAGPLVKRLMMYRLRRKIEIATKTGLHAGYLWGQGSSDLPLPEGCIAGRDERHTDLGRLVLFAGEDGLPERADEQAWQAGRISLGIPEGSGDLTPNRALMLEAGLDRLGAVDFDKGCYVGQEVTARTHYRGLVKRRLIPVLCDTPLSPGTAILRGEVSIGQTGSTARLADGRFISLASLRLDAVKAVLAGEAALNTDTGQPLTLQIPDWMHPLPGFDDAEQDR